MTEDKMAARIAALLAKAQSTTSEEEAALFFAKAEELMMRHSIDEAMLHRTKGNGKEPIVSFRFKMPMSIPARLYKVLSHIVFPNVIQATGLVGVAIDPRTEAAIVYGTQADCEHMADLVTRVWLSAYGSMKIWSQIDPERASMQTNSKKWAADNAYCVGYGRGVVEAIEEMNKALMGEIHGAEMVLVARKTEIDAFVANNTVPVKRRPTKIGYGLSKGYEAGKAHDFGNRVHR